jgi:hypothetical protein
MNYIRKIYEKPNKKYFGFITTGDVLKDAAHKTWDYAKEFCNIPFNGTFHLYVSEASGLFTFKP